MSMIAGARRLPGRHVSVRVPWHDSGWTGRVCANPLGNTHCIALPRIGDTRDDPWEAAAAGQTFDAEGRRLPACASERGAFMADFGYTRRTHHPYAHNELYKHFRETAFQHGPRSAAAVPFAWMMKDEDGVPEPAKRYNIDFDPGLEPDLPFETIWVQERRNQLAMLDTFFGAIEPEKSLVFFYAKRTPLTDDPRRVIVGIGRVRSVGEPIEYAYEPGTPKDAFRCMLWERNLRHSISPEIGDGFLLPYRALLDAAAEDPSLDLSSLVLHAPEEHWDAFSMGAEHVSHDQAISVLLSAAATVAKLETHAPGDWAAARGWIDAELNRLWRLRGAFPGLGSALTALGLPNGTLMAHAVGALLHADGSEEVRDPWPVVERILHEPKLLPADLAAGIGPAAAQLWDGLKPERRALLKLLARFELSAEQTARWFVKESRAQAGIDLDDAAILENPYLCYEADRGRLDATPLKVIDRGLFPSTQVTAAVPLPEPSACDEPIDPRRGRALLVSTLETASGEGHTILPQDWLVQRVRTADISPPCPIGGDWMDTFQGRFAPALEGAPLANGGAGWQLERYAAARSLIAARVTRRLAGVPHKGEHDWRGLIDMALGGPAAPADEMELMARGEKAAALEELFRSRVSVLIGPAGTGKTTLLTALLSLDEVAQRGVLLLAPTGKARVQMQRRAGEAEAYTLAQFLLRMGRYDAATGAYSITGEPGRENGYQTVVIDEASMLTEDQLAATLDALDMASVHRLILVGDPRQLPPIGAGRPFVDIIRLLRERADGGASGRTPGYAELKIVRRQAEGAAEGARDDILLARWFSGEPVEPGADEVWDRLAAGTAKGVRAVHWASEADLQGKLLAEIERHVRRVADDPSLTDEQAFEVSLGGVPFEGRVYFNGSREGKKGGATEVESWQLLAPIRSSEIGVDGLNRWIKRLFRAGVRSWAEPERYWDRKVCKPLGAQAIVYGDKVINVANGARRDVYPAIERPYLANGEIGLVVGQYKGARWKPKKLPWKLEVEFATQLGVKYGFSGRDFGEDGNERLELAYALTIHKAQGSEFGTTFVVVPNPCRPLSRELLYTALTRQRNEVVLFHQGELRDLMKLSQIELSDTARRLTNLFVAPEFVEHAGAFLEKGLVHRTSRGEMVRSKSEVIIADLLNSMDLPYTYEQPFFGADGSVRYPDFTIDDSETGRLLLVEHLGMMDSPDYRRRWERKLAWYREQKVFPVGEGGGDAGMLLTTTEVGGIDAAKIRQQISAALGL